LTADSRGPGEEEAGYSLIRVPFRSMSAGYILACLHMLDECDRMPLNTNHTLTIQKRGTSFETAGLVGADKSIWKTSWSYNSHDCDAWISGNDAITKHIPNPKRTPERGSTPGFVLTTDEEANG
jgi:hypothetical protein